MPLFMWAALDCPTAAAMPPGGPRVLARLTVALSRPARAGEPHTVVGWPIEHDGRKFRGGAAIHTTDGELCGYSEGLWIELRDPSDGRSDASAHQQAPDLAGTLAARSRRRARAGSG